MKSIPQPETTIERIRIEKKKYVEKALRLGLRDGLRGAERTALSDICSLARCVTYEAIPSVLTPDDEAALDHAIQNGDLVDLESVRDAYRWGTCLAYDYVCDALEGDDVDLEALPATFNFEEQVQWLCE